MNRKEKGYLFLGIGIAWAVSRIFALIRGDAFVSAYIGLGIAAVLAVAGLLLVHDLEFAFFTSRQKKEEGYKGYLERYD